MTDEKGLPERRVSHEAIIKQVRENKASISELKKDVEDLHELLEPVAEFYQLLRSDINTLSRFGRGLRSFVAWAAAIIISIGVLVAWAKNGFTFPGE